MSALDSAKAIAALQPQTDLSQLELDTAYRGAGHLILRHFYVPCLFAATSYDRAVGFFTSSGLRAAAGGLNAFIQHDGRHAHHRVAAAQQGRCRRYPRGLPATR